MRLFDVGVRADVERHVQFPAWHSHKFVVVGSSHFLIEILIAVNASREIARAKIGKLEKGIGGGW